MDSPCKHFETLFSLHCLPDPDPESVSTAVAEEAERMFGNVQYSAMAYASGDGLYLIPEKPPRKRPDVFVEISFMSSALWGKFQPAVLCMRSNRDVELRYYIPTRNPKPTWTYAAIHGTSIDAVTNMFLRMYSTQLRDRFVPKVIAAAVKVGQDIYAVPIPQRHNHAIAAAARTGHARRGHPVTQEMQGFLVSNGQFVSRKVAMACAVLSGQLVQDEDDTETELFSEDLW